MSPSTRAGRWSKELRLRKSAEFRQVGKGKRVVSRDLVVLHTRTSRHTPRFGLTVSRKVGNAVVRNRVKRWLREALRTRTQELGGVDVVLIARHRAGAAGYASISRQVGQALSKIGNS